MDEIRDIMARIAAERAAMSQEDREKLEREEIEAQRQSWIRAMAPCEHGVLDWEDCVQCRSKAA